MFGSFQTSNHHSRIAAAPKRGSTASCSKKARTSVCQSSKEAGGAIAEGETAAGKKVRATNGVSPRLVSASRARNVTEKSMGSSGLGQTVPLLGGGEETVRS